MSVLDDEHIVSGRLDSKLFSVGQTWNLANGGSIVIISVKNDLPDQVYYNGYIEDYSRDRHKITTLAPESSIGGAVQAALEAELTAELVTNLNNRIVEKLNSDSQKIRSRFMSISVLDDEDVIEQSLDNNVKIEDRVSRATVYYANLARGGISTFTIPFIADYPLRIQRITVLIPKNVREADDDTVRNYMHELLLRELYKAAQVLECNPIVVYIDTTSV